MAGRRGEGVEVVRNSEVLKEKRGIGCILIFGRSSPHAGTLLPAGVNPKTSLWSRDIDDLSVATSVLNHAGTKGTEH